MKRYSQIVGLPVFSTVTGNKLAEVVDLVFLRDSKKIYALTVGNRLMSNSNIAIMFDDISGIGNDAIMVQDKSVITKLAKSILKDKIELNGISIYTQEGKGVGIVKDILFDETTGYIEGVELSDSLLSDIISGRNIMPFSGKIILSEGNMIIGREAYDEILHGGGGLRMRLGMTHKQYNEANN